jgi:tetratricopeptide (TPR) repeat protein
MGNYKLNRKLLVWTLVLLTAGAAGVYLLHTLQVNAHAREQYALAEEAEKQGRLDRAATYLSRYLVFAPDDTEVLAKYGALLDRAAPKSPQANRRVMAALEQVVARIPACRDVRRRLAVRALDLGLFARARAHLEILVRSTPGQGDLEELLGQCWEGEGEYARAAQWYEQAVRHRPQQVATYVRLAEVLRGRLEQPRQADQVLERLVRENKNSFHAFLARARYQAHYGSATKAAKDLERAAELAPEDAEVLIIRADLARLRGRIEEGRRLWQHGLRLFPRDPRMYLGLTRLEWQCRRPREAVACLREGLRTLPDQTDLLHALAEVLIGQGELAEARALMSRLRNKDCVPALLAYLEGCIHIHRKEWLKAVRQLDEVSRSPGIAAELASRACEHLGLCFEQLGDADRRLTAFERAAVLAPASVSAHLGYGTALLALGRSSAAAEQLEHLAKLPDPPPEVWLLLGRALLHRNLGLSPQQRDWRPVDQALNRAEQYLDQAVRAAILRAEVLLARNQPEEARALLEKTRTSHPRRAAVHEALVDLAAREGQVVRIKEIWQEAYRQIGDGVEWRRTRLRFLARHGGREAAAEVGKLAKDLEKFSPEDQDALRWHLAEAYLRTGKPDEAARFCRQLAGRRPADLRCRLLLLDAVLQTGNVAAVEEVVAEVRRLEGEDGTWWRYGEAARISLTAAKGDSRRFERARQLLAEAGRRRPTWSRIPLLQARLDEREGNTSAAVVGYLRAVELGEYPPGLVPHLVGLLTQSHRFLEADQVIRRFEQQQPLDRALARVAVGIALRLKNQGRVLELARRAVDRASTDYRDHLWLGEVLATLSRHAEAEAELREAARLAGRVPDAWVALVAHLARTGKPVQAETVMRQMQAVLPAEQVSLALALCNEALARVDLADRHFQAAVERRPYDFLVLQKAARFYLRTLLPGKAEPLLRALLDPTVFVPDEDLAWARRQMALVLSSRSDSSKVREALALLDKNRTPAGEAAEDQRTRALVLATQPDKRREALQTLERFQAGQLLTAGEQFRLAQVYEAANNWLKARELMLEALAVDGHNPAYLAHFIEALLRRGKKDEARSWVAQLEKLEPQSPRTKAFRAQVGKPAPAKKARKGQAVTTRRP